MTITTSTGRIATAAAMAALVAVPAVTAAAPTAQAATPAAAAGRTVTTSVDMDGDGRADRTTLTTHSVTRSTYTFRLTTRTAKGRTASTLIKTRNIFDGNAVPRVWQGAAGIDGVRGGEIVLDLAGGYGDATQYVVYTMRNGRHQKLKAPGARSINTPWHVMYMPGVEAGYQFSTVKGVRTVTHTRLYPLTDEEGRLTSRFGFRTTYRWTKTGWQRTASVRVRDVNDAQAQTWSGWNGLVWR